MGACGARCLHVVGYWLLASRLSVSAGGLASQHEAASTAREASRYCPPRLSTAHRTCRLPTYAVPLWHAPSRPPSRPAPMTALRGRQSVRHIRDPLFLTARALRGPRSHRPTPRPAHVTSRPAPARLPSASGHRLPAPPLGYRSRLPVDREFPPPQRYFPGLSAGAGKFWRRALSLADLDPVCRSHDWASAIHVPASLQGRSD